MNIARVNHVLDRAIVSFQTEEIEILWEQFRVPTPMQMHKKHGMAIGVTDVEVLGPLEQALDSFVSGSGKLTDPNRTPNQAAVRAALDQIVAEAPRMRPKHRSSVLKELRGWLKIARQHAKRLQQAESRTKDVDYSGVLSARMIRDLIDDARAQIAPLRGGGPTKSPTTAKPGTRKPRKKPSPYKEPNLMQTFLGMDPEERKKQEKDVRQKWAGKYVVGDATIQTFLRILEAAFWKAEKSDSSGVMVSDFEGKLKKLKSMYGSKIGSDEKRDLKDLVRDVVRLWDVISGRRTGEDGIVNDWLVGQVNGYIKNGKLPFAPGGTMVRPRTDKRQINLKFEALNRLKLALVS